MKYATMTLVLLLTACGGSGSDAPAEPAAPPQGREETRGIRNTEAVGVPGDAIADRVDQALDANDARQKKLEQEMPQ